MQSSASSLVTTRQCCSTRFPPLSWGPVNGQEQSAAAAAASCNAAACRRDTFEEFIAQDRHYPAAASKVYSQALSKASSEGPTVFAMVREMLEDSHEELSLHAHYTEARSEL